MYYVICTCSSLFSMTASTIGSAKLEVEKLLRHASEWLPEHPMKEWIARRYFKQRRSLARMALEQLTLEENPESDAEGAAPRAAVQEMELEKRVSLNERRMDKVAELVTALGVKTAADLGCGEGRLLCRLLEVKSLDRLVGVDVSLRSLEHASERLNLDRLAPQAARTHRLVARLADLSRRPPEGIRRGDGDRSHRAPRPAAAAALERVLFEFARPTRSS